MTPLTSKDLAELNSSHLLLKLDELKVEAYRLGHEMAEAEYRYKAFKEMLPSILAEYKASWYEQGKRGQEVLTYALIEDGYRLKVDETNQLGHAYRLKEVEYRAVIKSLEALTAISFVRNNELKLARG